MAGIIVAALLYQGGLVGSAAASLGAAVVASLVVLRIDRKGIAALGFYHSTEAFLEAGRGLGLGVLIGLSAVAAIALCGGVRWSIEDGTVAGLVATSVFALLLFLLPAAAEEILFRGYPFQRLAEAWGAVAALLILSVLFGLLHLGNPGATWPGALNVILAGALLGVVFLRTGSLWWATGVHLGWNWSHASIADLSVSGFDLVDVPFIAARQQGPVWISGGSFGPEGSFVTTVVLSAALAWCWTTTRLRVSPAAARAGPIAPIGRLALRASGSRIHVEGSEPGTRTRSTGGSATHDEYR